MTGTSIINSINELARPREFGKHWQSAKFGVHRFLCFHSIVINIEILLKDPFKTKNIAILENQNNGIRISNPALPTSYTSTGICHQRTDIWLYCRRKSPMEITVMCKVSKWGIVHFMYISMPWKQVNFKTEFNVFYLLPIRQVAISNSLSLNFHHIV